MTTDTSREAVQRLADQECNPLDALDMAFRLLDRAEKAEAELATLKAERERLREAVWQALDDMGRDGKSVCGATKTQLIEAYQQSTGDDDLLPAALCAALW